jgi:carbonic anhydrase
MWFWIVSAIAGSILGNATNSWFADTKLGIWFYKKVDNVSTWASEKLGLKVLEDEEDWKKKYPNINKKIDELEAKIKKLEKQTVLTSIENLTTFPFIINAIKDETISLHGLWHDIGSGKLMFFDAKSNDFISV